MVGHAEQAVSAGRGVAAAALLLALAAGCATTGQMASEVGPAPPPVTQMNAIWGNHLMQGVDPVHNGAPMYGIAGRVFLYGPELKDNLVADGKFVVEMYGQLPEQPQGTPTLLESWELKKEILNSVCLRKDFVGAGYTLNLPWEHYRPDVTRLDIRVRYEPAKGGVPIYSQSVVMLTGGEAPTVYSSKQKETGDHRVINTVGAPPSPTQQPWPVMPPPVGSVPAQMAVPPQPGGVQPAVFQVPGAQPFPGAGMR